jgi:hypothetical protein
VSGGGRQWLSLATSRSIPFANPNVTPDMPRNGGRMLMSLITKSLGPSTLAALLILSSTPSLFAVHLHHHRNVATDEAIPKDGYKSWSLFLVCNPEWILANGDDGIGKLFRAYKAFGKAIGPKNLAVWFSDPPGEAATTENTDIERMSTYCQKFGLLPSHTPQVVTVTKYPDDPDLGGMIVANLNGNAENSARVLTDLTDELLKTGLNQTELQTSDWGHRVAGVASSVLSSASCYLNKVSISIKTGVFNAEIGHASDAKC